MIEGLCAPGREGGGKRDKARAGTRQKTTQINVTCRRRCVGPLKSTKVTHTRGDCA